MYMRGHIHRKMHLLTHSPLPPRWCGDGKNHDRYIHLLAIEVLFPLFYEARDLGLCHRSAPPAGPGHIGVEEVGGHQPAGPPAVPSGATGAGQSIA